MLKLDIFGEKYLQYLATFSVSLLSVNVGLFMSWSSPILPLLQSKDSPIGVTLTLEEGSWVASLLLLGSTLGSLAIGPLMNKFGRKGVLLLSAIPIFSSWMMILLAKSVSVLYVARFLSGIANFVPLMISVIYISEISEPSIRGKLGMLNFLMAEFGSMFVTVIGSYLSYRQTAYISSLFSVAFVITFYWMPESPYYYLQKGQFDNAEKALKRLRGNTDINNELLKLQDSVENEMKNKSTLGEFIRTPIYRKTLLIIIGLKTIQQFSGIFAINTYMATIFNQASTGLDSSQSSIISTAVSIPAIFFGSFLIDILGRKLLYYFSATGCAISLFCVATYFYLQNDLNTDMLPLGSLPLFGVLFFNISRVLGIYTMPYIIASELFPTNVKGIGLGIAFVYGGLLGFLVVLLFPYMVEAFGVNVCFLIFGVVCVLAIPYTMLFIPETKKKSLQEIQNDMEKCDKK